jgi:hypothetical protein
MARDVIANAFNRLATLVSDRSEECRKQALTFAEGRPQRSAYAGAALAFSGLANDLDALVEELTTKK